MRRTLTIAFVGSFLAQDPATERAAPHFDHAAAHYDARRYADAQADLIAARAVLSARAGSTTPLLKLISAPEATYPLSALEKGRAGVVGLRLTIDTKGKVKDVKVLQSIPGLDDAAKGAARNWRFELPMDAGNPIEMSIVRAISFVYRDDRLVDQCIALARFYETQNEFGLALNEVDRAIEAAREEGQWYSGALIQVGNGRPTMRLPGPDTIAPVRTINAPPVYPPVAIQRRVQGMVILQAVVDAQGIVRIPRVVKSVPMLDQAALDAVRKWRYSPAKANGQPVGFFMTVTVNFALQGGASSPAARYPNNQ